MRKTLSILALTTALALPAAAQEARLSGSVAEVFGSQIVLATPEGRILVTLPEGATAPAPGARVELTGTRAGQTFTALSVAEAGPAAPAPVSAPAAGLPAVLAALNPLEVARRSEMGRHGAEEKFYLRLTEGWIRAETRNGRLVEVKGQALPQAAVAAVLPQALQGARELTDFARITEVSIKPEGEIEVEGYDRSGTRIEVEWSADLRLREFERNGDDRRSLSETAAADRLAALGYREVAVLHRTGRHVEALARNPYGERVEVRLDERGQVDRERMLTN